MVSTNGPNVYLSALKDDDDDWSLGQNFPGRAVLVRRDRNVYDCQARLRRLIEVSHVQATNFDSSAAPRPGRINDDNTVISGGASSRWQHGVAERQRERTDRGAEQSHRRGAFCVSKCWVQQ